MQNVENFRFMKTIIDGLIMVQSKQYQDDRGTFYESFRKDIFASNGINEDFVQENISISKKNVIRGLHFQKDPNAQGKLIKVIKGRIYDVIVDLRKESPTYKKWLGLQLSENDGKWIYIPAGMAHGFLAKEDNTMIIYKCTKYYDSNSEDGIIWNDKDLNVLWGIDEKDAIISDKDKNNKSINQI